MTHQPAPRRRDELGHLALLLPVAWLTLLISIALAVAVLALVSHVAPGAHVPRGTGHAVLLVAFLASGVATVAVLRRRKWFRVWPAPRPMGTISLAAACVVLSYAALGAGVSMWDFGHASEWLNARAFMLYAGLWFSWVVGGLAAAASSRLSGHS